MESPYVLTRRVLGDPGSIAITPARNDAIRDATRLLHFGLGFEEKFDLVLGNHTAFERALLEMAVEHSVYPGRIGVLLDQGRHAINRHLANYLTTSRLYVDHIVHDVVSNFGADSPQARELPAIIGAEYDKSEGYRVIDALRNFVQHRGLPVHGLSFPMSRRDRESGIRVEFAVVPSVDVSELRDDKKFKKAVLSELEMRADKNGCVPLLPIVRGCTESLGSIHTAARKLVDAALDAADQLIADAQEEWRVAFSELTGLSVARRTDRGTLCDWEYINPDLTKRRKQFRKHNSQLTHMSRCYVSSEA